MSDRQTKLTNTHSQSGTIGFRLRVRANQLRRFYKNLLSPIPYHHPNPNLQPEQPNSVQSITQLWTLDDPNEALLTLGKIENLRVALRHWNGVTIQPRETISFWRQTGPPLARHGYVPGRELREGCIVPSPGGGICQLSNALYDLALRTDCDILERHRHTQDVPGSATSRDRDATVAYNHIDLRFRAKSNITITAELTDSELKIQFHTDQVTNVKPDQRRHLKVLNSSPNSCVTCGEHGCFQHATTQKTLSQTAISQQTFLIDTTNPELNQFLITQAQQGDTLLSPIDGKNPKFARYQLPTLNTKSEHATIPTLIRAFKVRAAKTPPDSRRAHLDSTARIAQALIKKIPYTTQHLVIDIAFLADLDPFLLQGRQTTVFLTRWPLKLIHELLDQGASKLKDAPQLADFRASQTRVESEWQSLKRASKILTSNPSLAQLLRQHGFSQVELTPYQLPQQSLPSSTQTETKYLFFPGPTAARKGAHAVREVASQTKLPLAVAGKNLEDPNFWQGITLLNPSTHPAENALAIISPGIYEDRPTRLLPFLKSQVPIITTPTSGLPDLPHIHLSEFNEVDCMLAHLAKIKQSHVI
jgi:hypothetical protein